MLQRWQAACRATRRGFADPRLVAITMMVVMAVVLAVRGDKPANAELPQPEMLGSLMTLPRVPEAPAIRGTADVMIGRSKTVVASSDTAVARSAPLLEEAQRADLAAVRAAMLGVPVRESNPGLYAGGTGEKLATVAWWERMAHCETASDWADGGQWSGGLGIYIGTWKAWGGLEFAKTPGTATKDEQIIVANRIASQGWMQPNGELKDPVWYRGWGGLHCAGNPREVSLTNTRAYTPGQLVMP